MAKDEIERKVEQLKEDEDVRRALEQTAGNKASAKPKVEAKHKLGLGIYILILFGLGVFYYLLRLEILKFGETYTPPIQRGTLGAMAIVVILMISKIIKVYFIS